MLTLLGWWFVATGLPVLFCSLVIFGRWRSNWTTLSLTAFAWLGAVYALFAGAWTYYSYWSAAVVLLFMIWAVAVAMQRLMGGNWAYPGLRTSLV